jgi:thiamine pyrophosphokinase
LFICGALGGRSDHLLANVLLLAQPSLAGVDVCLADGPETIRLATAGDGATTVTVWGRRGDIVSLLPFGSDAEGVETRGLLYPLRSETLYLGAARGVSNVMQGERAEVSLARGRLLLIHNRIETL